MHFSYSGPRSGQRQNSRHRSNRSVQVQGRSLIPRALRVEITCGWPDTAQVVEIEPRRISGHRMHLCPFIDALLAARRPQPTP